MCSLCFCHRKSHVCIALCWTRYLFHSESVVSCFSNLFLDPSTRLLVSMFLSIFGELEYDAYILRSDLTMRVVLTPSYKADKVTRRSTSRYVYILDDGSMVYISVKQSKHC